MSAAEKLKALAAEYGQGDFKAKHGQYFAASLTDALPQIVAVVEAAEEAARWIEGETSGFGRGGKVLRRADAALAALAEALTADGKTPKERKP